MTRYVVLREIADDVGDESFAEVAEVEARSSASAIRKYLNGSAEGGKYVAVPARSWKPVTVAVETKTALKFT